MNFEFAPFTLSTDRAELVGPEGVIALEPKAFSVLRLLVEHHDRVVSREEMIEVVWGGRFISDAAVATALKLARRAVGDDGVRQTHIRTLHGVGHRFVAPVQRRNGTVADHVPQAPSQRPTIAVLPLWQNPGDVLQVGDGLADDIIQALSRLRWLRVIARETTFRFRQDSIDLAGLRSVLAAGYALTGRVEVAGGRLTVAVTLIETAGGGVVWADRFSPRLDDIHAARAEIVAAVIGALDLQISHAEVAAARGKPTEALDAWGAYHLGMSHFHRFNAHDNAIALGLFERATRLDPGFATAFAARSFAKQQEVAQAYSTDHASIIHEMRRLAERAVELDPYDPFANMVMGRTTLLSDGPDEGRVWYDRATDLSPSFAKGHYSRGIIDVLAGRTGEARDRLDRAMGLSPMDPLLGIMLTAKSLSFMVEGRMDMAQDWALRSVGVNQTHFLVLTTAALTCQLAGDGAGAARWALHLRNLRPEATITPYLKTLHFADEALRERVRDTLLGLGMAE
jgi:TolB-like protein